MSELRAHILRAKHLKFLKRCQICNEDIIDETTFYQEHGTSCNNPRPVRKGEAADKQYELLCALLLPSDADKIEALPCKYIQTLY
jgi:hypothetical protein